MPVNSKNRRGGLFFLPPLLLLLLICLGAPSSFAQEGKTLEERVHAFTLKNGIRVLILERHISPTVSFYIRIKAGAVDEIDGKTGLAHLLEHMMFKGTKTIGTKNSRQEREFLTKIGQTGDRLDRERAKGDNGDRKLVAMLEERLAALQKRHRQWYRSNEIDRLYNENGAVGLNASTGQDMITYQVSLPANKAELWARIESDRMTNPVFREFYQERDVVMEERRQRTDADPDGQLYEKFAAAAFMVHPYRRPIIGWAGDISFLSMTDLERFFLWTHAPQNMVLTVVGDVETAKIRRLIETYFGRIPRRTIPPRHETVEPPQTGEKSLIVRFDANEQLAIGYHKPALPSRDDYRFDLIEAILSRGRSSRFYQTLVETQGIAESVGADNGFPGSKYPNLFGIFATVRHPHKLDKLTGAIDNMIDDLKKVPVTDRELRKVKNQLQADFIRRQNSNEGLASMLSKYETILGDWRYIVNYGKNIENITPEELRDMANRYLTHDNRTIAIMRKD
jgi:predicted Zn-dependent peptidase